MPTKKKVLIVEDDASLRTSLSDMLSRHYELVLAPDGEQGLSFVSSFKPDLILLDLLLPKLSGLDMLEQLRKFPDPAQANTKVLVFSNFDKQEYMARAQELKVSGYLIKASTNMIDLLNNIETILKSRFKKY